MCTRILLLPLLFWPLCGVGQSAPPRIPVEKIERSIEAEDSSAEPRIEVCDDAASDGPLFGSVNETMPRFRGGDLQSFREWVCAEARYPREAFDRGEEGRVYVGFVIDTAGRMTRVELSPLKYKVKGTDSRALEREALRAVRSSPRWTPGNRGPNREKVAVKYTLPVDFKLHRDPSDRSPAVYPPQEWLKGRTP